MPCFSAMALSRRRVPVVDALGDLGYQNFLMPDLEDLTVAKPGEAATPSIDSGSSGVVAAVGRRRSRYFDAGRGRGRGL
ncbi:MAG: hypothetical protein U1F42_01305 [Candidatus Competibacteraceae bacterium]